MNDLNVNRFIRSLREVCARRLLEEKWLLAPSLRVGFQWLDTVVRSGQPVVNLRVKTLPHMALEIASAEMGLPGAGLARGLRREVLVAGILGRLRGGGRGYLTSLEPGPALARALVQTIEDMRLAGLEAGSLDPGSFEVPPKGEELKRILAAYEQELDSAGLLDYAALLRVAAEVLRRGRVALPEGLLLLVPADAVEEISLLERRFLEAMPRARRILLEVDRPGVPREERTTDAALLGWIGSPVHPPRPRGDGTARIFRAVGERNEVREVLRRCVARGIPFDQVEILHTDAATYVPLIYEQVLSLADDDSGWDLPVTFADGIPARYGRPARSLLGWTRWIREGCPQVLLAAMVQDGLLKVVEPRGEGLSFSYLAGLLRSLPIGFGPDRYLRAVEEALAASERRLSMGRLAGSATEEDPAGYGQGSLAQRIEGLRVIQALLERLLGLVPGPSAGQGEVLSRAAAFLENCARHVNGFDEYVHKRLRERIEELAGCLGPGGRVEGLDVWSWLEELCRESPVRGEGPRPGRIHVASVHRGGHSGRRHTFIVGLDDGRFPGPGSQDPVLLDTERERVSGDLPTAAGRLGRELARFAALLARLRGEVTLSYPCRDLLEDRELFPSPVVLAAYRILAGRPEGDLEDLLAWLPEPVSFSPGREDLCLDMSESWMTWLLGEPGLRDADVLVGRRFPHLGRGMEAARQRSTDRFTAYDGYVPQAGRDLDPVRPGGMVLSARALETLGTCPMEYFFRYVLGIEPPEVYRADPRVWLESSERGRLLHTVFRRFMVRLREQGRPPHYGRDSGLLGRILEEEIDRWRVLKPVPNQRAFEAEVRTLRQASRIFLLEEERHCEGREPYCFEASIGMLPEGEGTPLDSLEPVRLELGHGRAIRARGRIDRVDEVKGSGGRWYEVWDYKTGSPRRYARDNKRWKRDPFGQGRNIQGPLYARLAAARLREAISPDVEVVRFGYFFAGPSGQGDRVAYGAAELDQAGRLLDDLCNMIASGCFPFTDDPGDVEWSDYRDAFGDVKAAADAVERKLDNPRNEVLRPFRRLRGHEDD